MYLHSCKLHMDGRGRLRPVRLCWDLRFPLGAVLWPFRTVPGCEVCLVWVHRLSFGFLLENVIFSSLCEKRRITVLLLSEGLL